MDRHPLRKRLKEARLLANLSQKSLGIAAGIDEFSASSRMNHYELGRHAPTYSMLKRIAKILKLPVAYFYAETEDLAQWIKLFSKMKKQDRVNLIKKKKW